MIGRRQLLGGLGAAAVVVGFDPIGRSWLTAAAAAMSPDFADAPPLDGVLLVDSASREAVATDKGNLVHRTPSAVLRPGSTQDIARMMRYCRRRGIKVSTRGQAHTTYGQGLCEGLVIENNYRDTIHSIGPGGADIDTGVLWKDLITAAYEHKLTPPVLTGYTAVTVGGTLSVGGRRWRRRRPQHGLAGRPRQGARGRHRSG